MTSVGAGIFRLITSGMYDNPLAVYREYIQNSADSLAQSDGRRGSVVVTVNRGEASITILDDGPGLSPGEAEQALLPVAQSRKSLGRDRGFRGIGRLSGLAFADSVTFLTRSSAGGPVTRVVWDGLEINRRMRGAKPTWDALRACVTVDSPSGTERPGHFFEAQIRGVGRHVAGAILNERLVRAYIGEVCPVPMRSGHPFAKEIDEVFAEHVSPLSLRVTIAGDPMPVTRPHGPAIDFSEGKSDPFKALEPVRIPSLNGGNAAAVGWVMHSSYLGAIPKRLGIRGIRARMGNIQIGDESIFDHLFPEERFNRWCVGEIHVLDSEMVPNARRDYFEPGPHVRNFENHLAAVCRKIADRCRNESKKRNRTRKLQSLLADIDDTCELAGSGYLTHRDATCLIAGAAQRVRQARTAIVKSGEAEHGNLSILDSAEARLDGFRAVRNGDALFEEQDADIYRNVFRALAKTSPSPRAAKEMIDAVLEEVRSGGH